MVSKSSNKFTKPGDTLLAKPCTYLVWVPLLCLNVTYSLKRAIVVKRHVTSANNAIAGCAIRAKHGLHKFNNLQCLHGIVNSEIGRLLVWLSLFLLVKQQQETISPNNVQGILANICTVHVMEVIHRS